MTRKHEDSDAGREARRITNGLFKRAVVVPSSDSERGANEGLGQREILALAEENGRPWGRSFAESVVACRSRQAGNGDCDCIPDGGACPGPANPLGRPPAGRDPEEDKEA